MKKIVKLIGGLLLLFAPLKQVIAATDDAISKGKITFSNNYGAPGKPSISDKLPQTGEAESYLWITGIVLLVIIILFYYQTSRKEDLL